MMHLNHKSDEVVVQVLGLVKLMTLNANIKAQDQVFEIIGDRDSMFCRRVYELLDDCTDTFRETWAKLVSA